MAGDAFAVELGVDARVSDLKRLVHAHPSNTASAEGIARLRLVFQPDGHEHIELRGNKKLSTLRITDGAIIHLFVGARVLGDFIRSFNSISSAGAEPRFNVRL